MKKFLSIFFALILCILIIGHCYINYKDTEKYSLIEINAVYDKNNNLLNQTLYNKKTGEYILQEYTYELCNKKFVCINQNTTVLKQNKKYNNATNLSIYHNKELENGPIVILDREGVKVSITKYLASDQWWRFGYELKIENTTNKVCSLTIDDSYIMGIKCKPLFSITHVEPNHTAYFNVAWERDELDKNYIPYVDEIEFKLRVFFNEEYNYDHLAELGNRILIKTN